MKINIKRPKNLEHKKLLDNIIDEFKDKIINYSLEQYVTYKSDTSDKCKTGCDWNKESSDNNSGAWCCRKCMAVKYE
jgi:hypothetical protein